MKSKKDLPINQIVQLMPAKIKSPDKAIDLLADTPWLLDPGKTGINLSSPWTSGKVFPRS